MPCGQSIADHPPEIKDSIDCQVCNIQKLNTMVYRATLQLTRCTPYALKDLVICLSALHVLLQSCYEIKAGALSVDIAGSAQFSHNSNLITFITNSKRTIYWTLSYPSNPESFIDFNTRELHLLFGQLINQMVLSNTAQLCFSWRGACSHFFELCVKNSATLTRFTPNPGCPLFIAWTDSEGVVCTAYKKWCNICNPNCLQNVEYDEI